MKAKYLLRFDDFCPTMNWAIWNEIEQFLVELDIRPILAVIPDNKDKKIEIDPPSPDFWDRVRQWQNRGWTIALHGYQHLYTSNESGIIGLNKRSEFAGLPYSEQEAKLKAGIEVFKREGVHPDLWVAPAHSFDENTINILKGLGIKKISDGFSLYPFKEQDDMVWIPQQIWWLRPVPRGVWTVCLHPNEWGEAKLIRFLEKLKRYHHAITSVDEALTMYCNDSQKWFEPMIWKGYLKTILWKQRIKNWIGK